MALSQGELKKEIDELSFAMDDTRLFLDTHPNNPDALMYYKRLAEMRKQTVSEYIKMYGPLSSYDAFPQNDWVWVDKPWPWEA